MTIGAASRVSLACDGVTKVFPVAIQAYAATDLTVILTAPASAGGGESTLTLNSDYSMAVSGTLSPTAWTLTTLAAAAYLTGYTLQVFANPVQTQQSQFVQGQAFPSLAVQTAFDRLTQMVQRLQDEVNRCVRAPDGDVNPLMLLPITSQRLSSILATDASGNITTGVPNTQLITTALLAPFLGLNQTAAEAAAGVTPSNLAYPPGNVLRYGLVPNSSGAASTNTAALKACWNPAHGISGQWIFPNTTGADVYYFNAVIPMCDGVHIDLNGCTINYTATTGAPDNISGLFFALRDFRCENGSFSLNVNCAQSSSGYAIQIGARANESSYFTVYDSLLVQPMGNVVLKNLRIVSANTGANVNSGGCIGLVGGLVNVQIENVFMDGGGNLGGGIQYEFGWATSGTTNLRQTSHMHNCRFSDIVCTDFDRTSGVGIILTGAYSATVENLYVEDAGTTISVVPGESLNYRPWVGVDQAGAKRTIALRNIVGQGLWTHGITLQGAYPSYSGYLAAIITGLGHPGDYIALSDLYDFTVDGFSVDGSGNPGNGYGVNLAGAARVDLRNGYIFGGFQRGVAASDETVNFRYEGLRIFACQQSAIVLDAGAATWSPTRLKKGEIRNCFIAGNSTQTPGASAAITLNQCSGVLIENNRFGHETAFDGVTETTQGEAVYLTSTTTALNVICRGNHVGAVFGGGNVAYHNLNNTPPNGDTVTNATGVLTTTGLWITDFESASSPAIANGATITTNGVKSARVNPGAAVTGIILQSGGTAAQEIIVINEAGPTNSVTFAAAGTSHVVDGVSSVIAGSTAAKFVWDSATSFWYHQK